MNRIWQISTVFILLINTIGCGMYDRTEEKPQANQQIHNHQVDQLPLPPSSDATSSIFEEEDAITQVNPLTPSAHIEAIDDLSLERGPYLQNGTGTSVWVIWRGKQPHIGKLEYGTSHSNKKTIITDHSTREHRIQIKGLMPGRKYYYRVTINGKSTGIHSFTTNKREGQNFRILVMGDSGIGTSDQYRMANIINRYSNSYDLAVHLGDIIYYKGESQYYNPRFFNPYQEVLNAAVMYTTRGNHDQGQAYFNNFLLPANGPVQVKNSSTYSFDYGDVHFVSLDSNLPHQDLSNYVVPWLERDLTRHRKRWTFVFFHHPPYTSGKYAGSVEVEKMKDILVPVLEKHKVDLVMSGHEHFYQRTKPINRITYLINGSAGMALGQQRHNVAYVAKFYNHQHSFTTIDVRETGLLIRTMNMSGQIVDSFWLTK